MVRTFTSSLVRTGYEISDPISSYLPWIKLLIQIGEIEFINGSFEVRAWEEEEEEVEEVEKGGGGWEEERGKVEVWEGIVSIFEFRVDDLTEEVEEE